MTDQFKKLSDSLSYFVENVKKYKENQTSSIKEEIEKNLLEMKSLSKVLNKKILDKYFILETTTEKFLEDISLYEHLMESCIDLKNELWEL